MSAARQRPLESYIGLTLRSTTTRSKHPTRTVVAVKQQTVGTFSSTYVTYTTPEGEFATINQGAFRLWLQKARRAQE